MHRIANLPENHSFFLFGARGTGKTWLLREALSDRNALIIDLLNPRDFDDLSRNPGQLSQRISRLGLGDQWVLIDEVQKIPALLDIVHLEIEAHSRSRAGVTAERPAGRNLLFALTGSSARKLKRGKANLLAGRAFMRHLFPITHREWPENFDLQNVLEWGALPQVVTAHTDEERCEILSSYVHSYLREEILEEQLAREAPPFRRFLEVAAQMNGLILNYSALARDVGVSTHTAQNYFQILEDTLIAHRLDPYHQSVRKRQRSGPKFYLVDLGLQRALSGAIEQVLAPANYGFGRAFEHFVLCEVFRLVSYFHSDWKTSYLCTKDNLEIDLVLERPGLSVALVEIKSTNSVQDSDLSSLIRLGKDVAKAEKFCLSLDPTPRIVEEVKVLPWRLGLKELGL